MAFGDRHDAPETAMSCVPPTAISEKASDNGSYFGILLARSFNSARSSRSLIPIGPCCRFRHAFGWTSVASHAARRPRRSWSAMSAREVGLRWIGRKRQWHQLAMLWSRAARVAAGRRRRSRSAWDAEDPRHDPRGAVPPACCGTAEEKPERKAR